ncbi:GlxA family transcriptional regulator [Nocardiopsis suaedae]|uniref:Helix-turn-helix domain-containing protein n=1 Tax=Nocardiopsis suaedae TaxID=3018444 RepID=A0ABT4TGR2_9ACTN|nr:helix-turn-helix domain-containing protein [Nocardiopsis suaedae]MDA2803292.1 helix-turn-helix domain-containing protein [Nocardiopsis suaedae]
MRRSAVPAPHRVAVLALPGVYPFELGIPARVFGELGEEYEVVTCGAEPGSVATRQDFAIALEHGPEALETADTVVIPPFDLAPLAESGRVPDAAAAALRRVRPHARIVSICTASFLLAALGLLDGRRAATHWHQADLMRRLFPRVEVDPGVLFVDEGRILTSAGAASGVDACLHLVRRDHVAEAANRAARACVVPPWRDGGQAQYIERPVPEAGDAGTSAAREWALARLDRPLTTSELARNARMSERTFARRFRQETGTSPGRWLTAQRVARARDLLEDTDLPVDRVAAEVGFATAASLRRHLHAAIGVSPLAYRRTFRSGPRAGSATGTIVGA